MADGSDASADGVASNAFLESMLLHSRSLVDFFVRTGKYATDILRTDFAPEWQPARTEAAQRAAASYGVLNKHLSHLTWERVASGKPTWDALAVVDDITHIADAWSTHLAATDRELYAVLRPHTFEALNIVNGLSTSTPTS